MVRERFPGFLLFWPLGPQVGQGTLLRPMSNHPCGSDLLEQLEAGAVRAATRAPASSGAGWVVHPWVKEGILDVFRESGVVPMDGAGEALPPDASTGPAPFHDKLALPTRRFLPSENVRIVPGGSSVRRGAHVAPGVVCMPPMYINVGAYVGAGCMVDSHALVGSCAQIEEGVHLSAAAQIGGVLEPAGARPVIIERGAFIGGNCGVYEGVLVGQGAVLAAGVVLTAATPVFDLVNEQVIRGTRDDPLCIPPSAVVIPGTRRMGAGTFASENGLSAACALIVKYRDAATDAATALEEALR